MYIHKVLSRVYTSRCWEQQPSLRFDMATVVKQLEKYDVADAKKRQQELTKDVWKCEPGTEPSDWSDADDFTPLVDAAASTGQ